MYGTYSAAFVEKDRNGNELRDVEWKLNDRRHFENWYSGKTGNSIAKVAVTDMYYIKDGNRISVNPPNPIMKGGAFVNKKGSFKTVTELSLKKRRREEREMDQLRSRSLELQTGVSFYL